MVNEQYLIPQEVKKPVEIVSEWKNEVPSYEEFMKTYESNEEVINSYNNEITSYGDVGAGKGYGPVYRPNLMVSVGEGQIPCVNLDSIFHIEYRIECGYRDKHFFKFVWEENYSNLWKIDGNLDRLYSEQDRIEEGGIEVVRFDSSSGRYKRVGDMEEEVKRQLRKDIRGFELAARNGERTSTHAAGSFIVHLAQTPLCYSTLHHTHTTSYN